MLELNDYYCIVIVKVLPSKIVWFSETINDSLWIRRMLGIAAALLLAFTNLVGLVSKTF